MYSSNVALKHSLPNVYESNVALIHMWCEMCIRATLLYYTCTAKLVLKQCRFHTRVLYSIPFPFMDGCTFTWLILVRFCVCMLLEIFTHWLTTLHKIILAHHIESCDCNCGFCASCGDLLKNSIHWVFHVTNVMPTISSVQWLIYSII